MNFENYRVTEEIDIPVDQELFDRLRESRADILVNLRPDKEKFEAQKESFFSGELEHPDFQYEKIKGVDFDTKEKDLLKFREDLKNGTYNSLPEVVVQTYKWKVNERIGVMRMLKEVQSVALGEDPERHMERYQKYVEFIYGKPDVDIFRGITVKLKEKLEKIKNDVPAEDREAFDRLMNISNSVEPPVEEEIPDFKTPVEDDEIISDPMVIKDYFEEAISEMGLEDWTVMIDETDKRTSFSVSSSAKKVYVPGEKKLSLRTKDMTIPRIRALIVHELGTHAIRGENGARSKLKLLSTGLDRYLVGEEGVATYREHQEAGTDDYAGFENYFASSLAVGLDGGGKRNFRQVFEIMKDYYKVCADKDSKDAQEKAWDKCKRIFKGSATGSSGVIFSKDLLYRKGNIALYKLMKKDGSEKIDLNIGKFDPTNPRHIHILVELGMLDEDLEMLNS